MVELHKKHILQIKDFTSPVATYRCLLSRPGYSIKEHHQSRIFQIISVFNQINVSRVTIYTKSKSLLREKEISHLEKH